MVFACNSCFSGFWRVNGLDTELHFFICCFFAVFCFRILFCFVNYSCVVHGGCSEFVWLLVLYCCVDACVGFVFM